MTRRVRLGPLAVLLPWLVASAASAGTPAPAAGAAVNDRNADTTSRDTQSGAAVLRVDASGVLVVFNDTGSSVSGASHLVGYARSTDGGASFSDLGRLPDSASGDGGFPSLARDAVTGRIYLATLSFNATNVQVFRSDDGGATWLAPVSALTASVSRPWLAVDAAPGVGQGTVYVLVRDTNGVPGIRLARSFDQGATFAAPVQLTTSSGQLAFVATGPDHSVYAFYLDTGNVLRVRRSTNLGAGFAAATTVATLVSAGGNGDLGVGFRTSGGLQAVVSPITPGLLFATWADRGAGVDRADIFVSRSADFGTTWSAPARVNTDPTTNDQVVPTIAMTTTGSHLFIGWYDRRNDVANTRLEYFGRVASVTGTAAAFRVDTPLSGGSFVPIVAQDPALVTTYFVDYDAATADDTAFFVPYVDTRSPSAAHALQPDVRMLRVPADVIDPLFANGFE